VVADAEGGVMMPVSVADDVTDDGYEQEIWSNF